MFDVVGTMIYNIKTMNFDKGPIFANFVLADEINRAPASAIGITGSHAGKTSNYYDTTFKLDHFSFTPKSNIEQEGTYHYQKRKSISC
jgi:MoxR-like ATPase